MLLSDPVELCLVDWNMPKMNGVEFITNVRTTPHLSGLPVVLVTEEYEQEKIDQAMGAGADGYLAKPFDEATLLAAGAVVERPWGARRPPDGAPA